MTKLLIQRFLSIFSVGLFNRKKFRAIPREGVIVLEPPEVDDYIRARHLANLLNFYRVDCILDVGANKGDFGWFLRYHADYQGRIHSFEPVREVYAKLEATRASDPLWYLHNAAVGNVNEERDISVMANTDFSSFLTPNPEAGWAGENLVVKSERVTVKRLDDVWENVTAKAKNIMLKTDTQGNDLAVLKGAGEHLSDIAIIQVELSFQQAYFGMPTGEEVLDFLKEKGFLISGLFPVASRKDGSIVEGDCLLVNPQHFHKQEVDSC